MSRPLEGRTVALAEGRQLEELVQMLEKEGAIPLRCPIVSILDAPDPAPVLAWVRELIADRFDYTILLTGEGVRRLLDLAGREGLREELIAALSRTRTVTRGPKPVRTLKEIGVVPGKIAVVPTTEGVLAALRAEPLRGKVVGVQRYAESNPPLTEFLHAAGAEEKPVLPYVYAPRADAERVVELIQRLNAGTIDVLLFTSSPQVDRLVEVAAERGLANPLQMGFARTCIAAVGPIVAESLRRYGATVHVCPEQGFVMKNLVRALGKHFDAVR